MKEMIVQKGADPSHLIMAFTGMFGPKGKPFNFFKSTAATDYSRILLRDDERIWYHGDVYDRSVVLWSRIKELAPKTTCAVGVSAGGYAAIMFGYTVGVDVVHAFSPQTFVDKPNMERVGDNRFKVEQEKLYSKERRSSWFYDLKNLLVRSNGTTTYNIYACDKNEIDVIHASHLVDIEEVNVYYYDCNNHNVAQTLKRGGILQKLLSKKGV